MKGAISTLKELEKEESRYYNMFKNSAVAIWEEDFSKSYELLETLPCSSREDYSKYLDEHPEILKELINRIIILDANEAAVTLFAAGSKDQLHRLTGDTLEFWRDRSAEPIMATAGLGRDVGRKRLTWKRCRVGVESPKAVA